ncbi:macrolide family glycosyltransferase [Streptomyces sp. CBMA123]|uniref:macrolide family glycosyltransferase n=1 Tax=Streptomyces sp. CBMA123 TaxID=1896313 RepID=UPI001661A9D2|nr:macrolide family glycosyltransferase [Streptomyces sp. CBMA123]MBD0690404.1 glycosyl transferase [Streptomyces sp. CBMA123]
MPRPAHIAMVNIPAHGHVNPSLDLIRELVTRGHRVSYVNDPSFAEQIEATGARFVPHDTGLTVLQGAVAPGTNVHGMIFGEAQAMLPRLREAFQDDRPDLVLYDFMAYAGRVLADGWGVPSLLISPSRVAPPNPDAEPYRTVMKTLEAEGVPERFAQWLADNGVPPRDIFTYMLKPDRGISLIPRALQSRIDQVDPEVFSFAGPCLDNREHQGSWTRPQDAGKVLLVSLGSAFTHQPAFYRACLEAFGDLPGWHVVLQVGSATDQAELGPIPANVEVHAWVPQFAVLQQADAFITHAGMGGCSEGLYCGLPMVAVPQAADQFENADRLVELGVARRLDTALATPAALRSAVLELTTDPAVAARLAELSAEVRAGAGAPRAADLVEAALV